MSNMQSNVVNTRDAKTLRQMVNVLDPITYDTINMRIKISGSTTMGKNKRKKSITEQICSTKGMQYNVIILTIIATVPLSNYQLFVLMT